MSVLDFFSIFVLIHYFKYSSLRILFHHGFRHIHRAYFYTGPGGRYFGFDDGFRHRIHHRAGFRINTRYFTSARVDLRQAPYGRPMVSEDGFVFPTPVYDLQY